MIFVTVELSTPYTHCRKVTLSDRLVEAKFIKRDDGKWDYVSFPFVRCRIVTDEQKSALTHNSKLLGESAHILMSAFILKWALLFPALYFIVISLRNDTLSTAQSFVILAIPLLPPILALPYLGYKMWQGSRSKSLIRVDMRSAEKGRRIGYLESLNRTGRTLGPINTVLILAACSSAILFSVLLGSMFGSVLSLSIGPVLLILICLPLFWSGLTDKR